MTDIRKYIDLVEAGFAFQQPRAFGRKGVTYTPQPPRDENQRANLERCKQYPSAEAYDEDHNMYYPLHNTDPQSIRDNARNESERLKAQWNHWKNAGYF